MKEPRLVISGSEVLDNALVGDSDNALSANCDAEFDELIARLQRISLIAENLSLKKIKCSRQEGRRFERVSAMWNNRRRAAINPMSTDAQSEEETIEERMFRRGMRIGSSCLLLQASQSLVKATESVSLGFIYTQMTEIESFIYAGDIINKFRGIAITDLQDSRVLLRRYSIGDLFRYFVDMSTPDVGIDEMLAENTDNLSQEHPQLAVIWAKLAKVNVEVLLNLSTYPGDVNKFASQQKGVARESAECMSKMCRNVSALRDLFYETLLDPTKPDFQDIKSAMEYYISGADDQVIAALQAVRIFDPARLQRSYRTSQRYVIGNQEAEFYKRVAEYGYYVVEKVEDINNIPTVEDLDTILLPNNDQTERDTVDLISLKESVDRVAPVLKGQSYGIEIGEGVIYGSLILPTEGRIDFDRQNPRRFMLNLTYLNDCDEKLDLNFYFDLRNLSIDWNFLESPDDPRMTSLKIEVFRFTKAIFERWSSAIKVTQEESRPTNILTSVSTSPKLKQPYTPDTWRKELRKKQPIKEEELKDLETKREEGNLDNPNRLILIPESSVMEEMLESLSYVDRQNIQDGIVEFNERGVGKFTRKKMRLNDDRVAWTLRVNTRTKGDARVLVKEAGIIDRVKQYEVVDIRYRKDIYRKNHM